MFIRHESILVRLGISNANYWHDQSDDAIQEIQSNASKIMELVDDILKCETFEDLIALGERNEAFSGSDYDLFENRLTSS